MAHLSPSEQRLAVKVVFKKLKAARGKYLADYTNFQQNIQKLQGSFNDMKARHASDLSEILQELQALEQSIGE